MLYRQFVRFLPLSWRIRLQAYRAKRRHTGNHLSETDIFAAIYAANAWKDPETVSGPGSQKQVTQPLIAPLNRLLDELNVRTLLDLPCGDGNWIFDLSLNHRYYIGADIVSELVDRNQQLLAAENRAFQVVNIATDPLPQADLLLCRDCFVHLSNAAVQKALIQIAHANITHVLLTHFPDFPRNYDIPTGEWRPVNLQLFPYNLPKPERIIEEWLPHGMDRRYRKVLALWRVEDLRNRQ